MIRFLKTLFGFGNWTEADERAALIRTVQTTAPVAAHQGSLAGVDTRRVLRLQGRGEEGRHPLR
jgi:hypothetical protein